MPLFRFARLRALAFAVAALLVWPGASGISQAAEIQPLEIVTKTGVQMFSVEMAKTEKERETGLMYRKEMADGRGMLFDFTPEQQISMWMKNTYLSLDMLFLDEAGTVTHVATHAQPVSLALISSQGPVRYVVELNGGAAASYGVKVGDRLEHRSIPAS